MRKVALLLISSSAIFWGRAGLPASFEPNRGQAPAGTDFIARGSGYLLSLSATRAELRSSRSRISAVLLGADARLRGEAEERLPGVVNYLRRDQPLRAIPTYSSVRYRDIYRGIDVVFYGGSRLEYDFNVAPGADPRQIRLRYEGSNGIHIDPDGDLIIDTADGSIRQYRPIVYQQAGNARHEIPARYLLHGNTVKFAIGRYDRSQPLVIDPALAWATYLGGSSLDSAESIVVDGSGNTYVAGWTVDPTYGDADAFISKLTPDASSTVFTTIFPGSGNDMAHGIAVDAGGNMYVAGETTSGDFYADTSYISPYAQPGIQHVFVSKVDSTGQNLIYSHYVGGSSAEIAYALAIDSGGNAYVTGTTNSPDFPASSSAPQRSLAGNTDAFIIKFDPNGRGLFSTYLGGSGNDAANAIAVDASGNVVVTGQTTSTNFPVSAAYQSKIAGGMDAFVAKLSSTGTLIFSTYIGGSSDDSGNGIAVDSSGAIYVTGETASADFPTVNAFQKAFGGGSGDAFVAKLSPDGSALVYSTFLGGTGEDLGAAIAVDSAGNAFLTGSTTSTDLTPNDAFQSANKAPGNALVAALDSTGANLLFASYLGGSGTAMTSGTAGDFGNAIAVSCASGVTVAGSTASSDFPTTANVVQPNYAGSGDAFLARISAVGTPTVMSGGVVNSANMAAGPVAPGSLVTILGSNLGIGAQTAASAPWGTSLAGATLTVNGNAVPVAFVSGGRIDFQLPYETGAGNAVAIVTVPCGASAPVIFQVAQAEPYIRQNSNGDAIAFNADNTANSASNPAKTGSVITVNLTGIGPVDNPVPTGAAARASPLSQATLPKSATVGGTDAAIQFLGLAPGAVGLAQANLVLPMLSSGAYQVVITVGGVASNAAMIYVQ